MPEDRDTTSGQTILRLARLLGRLAGILPAFILASSQRGEDRPQLASQQEIRAVARELGLSADLPLERVKLAIADAIPAAGDETLARALARLDTDFAWMNRVQAITVILQRLGPP